jgi:hypothetical protein
MDAQPSVFSLYPVAGVLQLFKSSFTVALSEERRGNFSCLLHFVHHVNYDGSQLFVFFFDNSYMLCPIRRRLFRRLTLSVGNRVTTFLLAKVCTAERRQTEETASRPLSRSAENFLA